jgi:hypothetical protein
MEKDKLVFEKMNYVLMIGGIIVLIIGLFVMTMDDKDYGFGSLGITVGPIIVLLGLVLEFFAIFYKPKRKE